MMSAVAQAVVQKLPEYNRLGLDYHRPMPRPKVRGITIDFHVHITAAQHGRLWFRTASHYGLDCFVTMTPLEEAAALQRDWPGRLQFIAIPKWRDYGPGFVDDWLRRIEAYYNMGSRIAKFWFAPPAWGDRGWRLDSAQFRPLLRAAVERGMAIMTHVGDPDLWYRTRYADSARYGTREDHYRMWENVLDEYPGVPWVGAHLGGNPENIARLQRLLDKYPNLNLDCSATRWLVREISYQRDEVRKFVLRNQDRLLFGTDLVTTNDRGYDFLASRFWTHRMLWETAYVGPSPILDPDLPEDRQPVMRGLALPDECLQKIYHDNAVRFLSRIGASFQPDLFSDQ